jgi:hypothetical protein
MKILPVSTSQWHGNCTINFRLDSILLQHPSLGDILTTQTPLNRFGKISYGIIAGLLGAPTIIVIIALLWGGIFKW